MLLNSLLLTIISPRLLAKATVAYFVYDLVSIWLQGNRYLTMDTPLSLANCFWFHFFPICV